MFYRQVRQTDCRYLRVSGEAVGERLPLAEEHSTVAGARAPQLDSCGLKHLKAGIFAVINVARFRILDGWPASRLANTEATKIANRGRATICAANALTIFSYSLLLDANAE